MITPRSLASLIGKYSSVRETSFSGHRIGLDEILPLIRKIQAHPRFKVREEGESIERRKIFSITIGTGQVKILAWSQMHGDEPTATMALFDLFNYLQLIPVEELELICRQVTLCFVPLLNPDGAYLRQRENAAGIDINRDARSFQSPEARLLKRIHKEFNPDFALNLHDQSRYYAVGNKPITPVLAFLAPPFDNPRSMNPNRKRAMQVIGLLFNSMQSFLPDQMARFADEFEPRAFGDNMQKWGTSTILIESGHVHGDEGKDQCRKYTFLAILSAIEIIRSKSYVQQDISTYKLIPNNEKRYHDLIIRNARSKFDHHLLKVDIAINREEKWSNTSNEFTYSTTVEEVGDLKDYFGHEEIDALGLDVFIGFSAIDSDREAGKWALKFKRPENIVQTSGFINGAFEANDWLPLSQLPLRKEVVFLFVENKNPRYLVHLGKCYPL